MRAVSVVVDPLSGLKPILANAEVIRADFPITTRSAAAISDTLPPATWPCTAATTGARIRTMRTMAACQSAVQVLIVAGNAAPAPASAARSPPTLNILPRADNSTARTSLRSLISAMPRLNSRLNSPSTGLPLSGRLRKMWARPSLISHPKVFVGVAKAIAFAPSSRIRSPYRPRLALQVLRADSPSG